jgi:hypothetical protein
VKARAKIVVETVPLVYVISFVSGLAVFGKERRANFVVFNANFPCDVGKVLAGTTIELN